MKNPVFPYQNLSDGVENFRSRGEWVWSNLTNSEHDTSILNVFPSLKTSKNFDIFDKISHFGHFWIPFRDPARSDETTDSGGVGRISAV